MSVGKRIKEVRKKLNLTQSQLAEKVNVSPQVISNWEREYTTPNAEDIASFAKTLDINTQFLYGKTDDPFTKEERDFYDPLSEINKLIKQFGIEDFGFFNIEEWKNFTPEDVEELKRHFEWVAHKARERNEEKK